MTKSVFFIVVFLASNSSAQLIDLSGKGVAFDLTSNKPEVKKPEPLPPVVIPEEKEPEPTETHICQCRGSNRGVCYCLKANVKCGCNPQKGSEWTLEPLKKTGRYFNPDEAKTASVSLREPQRDAKQASYEVTIDQYNRMSWVVNGVNWSLDSGYRMSEGQKDGTGRWQYKNGRMLDLKSVAESTKQVDTSKAPELPSTRRAIYFGAIWCPGCVWMYQNTLPDLQDEGWRFGKGDNLHVQIVDADADTYGLMQKYGVTSLPTTIILDNGKEIDRMVGAINASQFKQSFFH